MIKPERLKKGDTVAIVSLSSGSAGDEEIIHRFKLGKKRLEEEFGLNVVIMPNALKGSTFVYNHPELRAKDFMEALKDKKVKAIISNSGGDDTIRILPYIDFETIKNNPKIFMGFSDTTANHFMMYKAGVVSYYGPAVLLDFGEYVSMFEYTKEAVKEILFNADPKFEIKSSPEWTKDYLFWKEENINIQRKLIKDKHGYEVLQGKGKAQGRLLGGCIELLNMINGTEIWPKIDNWKGKILFIETSEEKPNPSYVKYTLRNLQAQGIIGVINGIIVGKPRQEKYYREYKKIYKQVVGIEANRPDLPIIYNVNFGHASPIGIIPYGINCELDCDNKKITLLEAAVK